MSSAIATTNPCSRRLIICTLTWMISGIVTIGWWVSAGNIVGFTQVVARSQQPCKDHDVVPGTATKRVFYNRVPKCGSTLTMVLFMRLAEMHGWLYPNETSLPNAALWTNSQDQLNKTATLIMSYHTPMLFSMHSHYFNITRFTSEPEPLLINIIRDPLDRLISWYYFIRFAKGHRRPMTEERRNMTFDECVTSNNPECTAPDPSGFFTLVPYFCGHNHICRYPNPTALRRAQYHVSRYLVVGLIEHYEDFLFVLDSLLPSYFKGATAVYKGLQKSHLKGKVNVHNYKKPAPSGQTAEKMKQLMDMEYEFYYFVKQRFFILRNSLTSK